MKEWLIKVDLNVLAAWWGALIATVIAVKEFTKRPKIKVEMSCSVMRDQHDQRLKDKDGNPAAFLRVEI